MSDFGIVGEPGDPLTIASQLANQAYQAIAILHQQNPDSIAEKFRQRDWQAESFRSEFVQKVATLLAETPISQQVQKCHQVVLKQIFDAAFLSTSEYQRLLAELGRTEKITLASNHINSSAFVSHTASEESEATESENQSGAFALLLLDAENLQLNAQQEIHIANLCDFPLQIKIAFANWRRLKKQFDAELHQRDYDLIHVPTGDDMADGKMIAVGSSLQEHYSKVKEVLVCSSDKVMINLCTKLRQQGLTVHKLQKQADGTLCFTHGRTNQVTKILESMPPDLESSIAKIRQIVLAEQKTQASSWVKLSTISERFRSSTNFPITSVVNAYMSGKRARDLFLNYPDLFVVHQPSQQSELYISLFNSPEQRSHHPGNVESNHLVQGNLKVAANTSNSTDSQKTQALVSAISNSQYGKKLFKH